MYVNEAMTSDIKTCRPHSSLNDVARMMWEGDCGAIPVVGDDNKPVGIITDRDIAMAAMLNHQALWEIQASAVIQGQSLCCCKRQDSLESCLQKMEQSEVRRMLVTDDDGALVGILSIGDALAFTRADDASTARGSKVAIADMIGMLKKVSAHHADNSASAANELASSGIANEQPNSRPAGSPQTNGRSTPRPTMRP